MSNDDKKPKAVREKSQALSNAIMEFRTFELLAMEKALLARNALIVLQNELMDEGKVDGMDAAAPAKALMMAAAGGDAAREVHFWLRDIGRKIGEPMPKDPVYDPEYVGIFNKTISVITSPKPRR
jgi:hypothetical protein